MDHPFLKNIRLAAFYFIAWLIYLSVYFSVLHFYFHYELVYSLTDVVVFNTILSFLSLTIWYVVRFEKPGNKNIVNTFISQLTSLVVFLLVWFGLGYILIKIIVPADSMFFKIFHTTIPRRIFEGVSIYALFTLIYYIIIYNRNMQEKILSEALLQEKIKEAELNLLKSQINPHFLFNSLNSISSLTMTAPEKAQEMIIKLSDYLRYSVSNRNNVMPALKEELDNIQKYLDIEKVRFGDKLHYKYQVPENCLNLKIPAMILQPLYENAVKHGVYESTKPIEISTKCLYENNNLYIYILNNIDKDSRKRSGAGIGLKNISERLRLVYGTDQLLTFKVNDSIYEVNIIIPQTSVNS